MPFVVLSKYFIVIFEQVSKFITVINNHVIIQVFDNFEYLADYLIKKPVT